MSAQVSRAVTGQEAVTPPSHSSGGDRVAPASAWAVPLLQCRPTWAYLIEGGTEPPRSLPKDRIHQNGEKKADLPKSAQAPDLRGQRGGVTQSCLNARQTQGWQ